jgi:hypothetical protein
MAFLFGRRSLFEVARGDLNPPGESGHHRFVDADGIAARKSAMTSIEEQADFLTGMIHQRIDLGVRFDDRPDMVVKRHRTPKSTILAASFVILAPYPAQSAPGNFGLSEIGR